MDDRGPDPVASFDGDALQAILAAVRDRNAAQARIEAAVAHAQGASWTVISGILGVTRQAALKKYHHAG